MYEIVFVRHIFDEGTFSIKNPYCINIFITMKNQARMTRSPVINNKNLGDIPELRRPRVHRNRKHHHLNMK